MKGTTKSKGQKDLLDRFYTKPEVAEQCINYLTALIDIYPCYIMDPCSGRGAFCNCLIQKFKHKFTHGFDIDPTAVFTYNHCSKGTDFLKFHPCLPGGAFPFAVVSNPPFGNQSSMALKFIKHAAKLAEIIAFILPNSFYKESMQKKIKTHKVIGTLPLKPNSFYIIKDGIEIDYSVPCSFFVFGKSVWIAEEEYHYTHLFEFTDKEHADCRIQRIGGNAGKCDQNLHVSPSSNYFIKLHVPFDEFKKIVDHADFTCRNWTVGPRSISKQELVKALMESR